MLTSFQNGSTILGPGANQKEPFLVLKSLSRRVIANRQTHYPYRSNDRQEKKAATFETWTSAMGFAETVV
ncbi:MAG TPA: hypothetical protein DEF45_17930 [Rhodopirellula sp.]|nr:hypothetical protein [Rhodopirellula sp.]